MNFKQTDLNAALDKLLVGCSIFYVAIPVVIFGAGWLKPFLFLPFAVLLLLFSAGIFREMTDGHTPEILFAKSSTGFWFVVFLASAFWVYLSGIGSLVFQNGDFWVRNPLFRDLATLEWPVVYDLSKQSETVQELCGNTKVALSYYFAWWLPVAATAKLFHIGEVARNLALSLWAFLGVICVIYLLCRKLKRCTYIVPALMIFFSGLDIIPYVFLNGKPGVTAHLEWWARFFQYSSNTTQLFWVFNQSLPTWMIAALLLQCKENRFVAALCSLTFAYSPWAMFGMFPYAVAASFQKGKIKRLFHPANILVPLLMLLIFGTFYLASEGSKGVIGLVFMAMSASKRRILMSYFVFIFFEVGVYFLLLGKRAFRYEYYFVTLVELILIPLFIVRDGNFIMRGSIPALFFLMYYVIRRLCDNPVKSISEIKTKPAQTCLIAALLLGAITPTTEINRTVKHTMQNDSLLQESVNSFANMRTEDEGEIIIAKNQFFVYDFEEKLFFQYLAK